MSSSPTDSSCVECSSVSMTRRGFLQASTVAGGLTAATMHGGVFSQTAYAAPGDTSKKVLVVVFMRGAVDGLSLVVPHADPLYAASRPSIGIPTGTLLAADSTFGLHPDFAPLLPMWHKGQFAAIHATGMQAPNRSHFAAMEIVEDADPGTSARVGWMNRMLGEYKRTLSPVSGMHIGSGVTPVSLQGPNIATTAKAANKPLLPAYRNGKQESAKKASLKEAWFASPSPQYDAVKNALGSVDALKPARGDLSTKRTVTYPKGDLGAAFANTAHAIKSGIGVRLVSLDAGGWDHHYNMGTHNRGLMHNMLTEFTNALAAFFSDMAGEEQEVTVVTMSEFGRRIKQNGAGGLDHGYGNVMLALGAGVKGGYYGEWPGLSNSVDGDLKVTTDYRHVLSEVLDRQFNTTVGQVFPGFSPTRLGFMQ